MFTNLIPYGQKFIYYAHNKEKYHTYLESYEKEIIKENFLKSTVINPSDYDLEWKQALLTEYQIINRCFAFIQQSDCVVFSSIAKEDDHFVIGKGTFSEILFAQKLGKKVFFLYMYSVSEGFLLSDFELREERGGSWKEYMQVFCSFDYATYTSILDFHIATHNASVITSPIGIDQQLDILRSLFKTDQLSFQRTFMFLPSKKKIFYFLHSELLTFLAEYHDEFLKVSLLVGKQNFCLHDHYSLQYECETCVFRQNIRNLPEYFKMELFEDFNENLQQFTDVEQIKISYAEFGCPYYFFFDTLQYADIVLTTQSYLTNANLRLFFTKDILHYDFLGNRAVVFEGQKLLFASENSLKWWEILWTCNVVSGEITSKIRDTIRDLSNYTDGTAIKEEIKIYYKNNPYGWSNEYKDIFERTYKFFSCLSNELYRDNYYTGKMNIEPASILNFLNNFDKAVVQCIDYGLLSNLPSFDQFTNYYQVIFPFTRKNIQLLNFTGYFTKTLSKMSLKQKWGYCHEITGSNIFGNTLVVFKDYRTLQYTITQTDKEIAFLNKKEYYKAYETTSKLYYTHFDSGLIKSLSDCKDRTRLSPFTVIIFFNFPKNYVAYPDRVFLNQEYEAQFNRFQFAQRMNDIISLGINKLDDFCTVLFLNADLEYFESERKIIWTTDDIFRIHDKIKEFWGSHYVY